MSKHKKTKEQKIISSLHRQLEIHTQQAAPSSRHIVSASSTYSYKAKPSHGQKTVSLPASDLAHVRYDLIKTTLLTSSIVAALLVLYYVLKTHLIAIPLISY